VAARVRIHSGTPGIRVHLAAFRIERTVKLPNPAAGDATKTLGGQRIRPRRRVLAALRIHGASSPARASWRPAAPRIRHCAGRHRAPGAKPGPPMASGMPNPVTAGASWLGCASRGPVLGAGGAIGLGMGMDGVSYCRRPRAACYMGRGFSGEKRNRPSQHISAALSVLGAGGFTVLGPDKLRLLPGRLPRWANPWTDPFSGAETLRARGRALGEVILLSRYQPAHRHRGGRPPRADVTGIRAQ